jgi:hypothetical protein
LAEAKQRNLEVIPAEILLNETAGQRQFLYLQLHHQALLRKHNYASQISFGKNWKELHN